jgi:hypothetical protein
MLEITNLTSLLILYLRIKKIEEGGDYQVFF